MIARIAFAVALCALAAQATSDPARWNQEWPNTDFTQTTVEWSEIFSGGPPKDGIPAIDDPSFLNVGQADGLEGREPVIAVELGSATARAYPLRYLTWHEIVNDTVGDVPVAVTFCPLCNSAIVFDRRVNGELRSFGVSGKLRNSDMVMYDRETESWWQQALGEGIVGVHTGDQLTALPTWLESWDEFRERNPNGLVMAQPRFMRMYGRNPYGGYDSSSKPFLYNGEMPPHEIPPLVRVIRVGSKAWPLTRLREEGKITEDGVTLDWTSGQASALDTDQIAKGKDVGTVRVRDANGNDLAHDVMFAFAFHAFWPDGAWMLGS